MGDKGHGDTGYGDMGDKGYGRHRDMGDTGHGIRRTQDIGDMGTWDIGAQDMGDTGYEDMGHVGYGTHRTWEHEGHRTRGDSHAPARWNCRGSPPGWRASPRGAPPCHSLLHLLSAGMNAAVRAVTRMGIYVGAKVFLIYEVCPPPAPPKAARP